MIQCLKNMGTQEIGVCSVMHKTEERGKLIESIGINRDHYIQGENKFESLLKLREINKSPSTIDTLILVDNYSLCGEELSKNSIELNWEKQKKLGIKNIISVIYNPKESMNLETAYENIFKYDGVLTPRDGEDYGTNLDLLNLSDNSPYSWVPKVMKICEKGKIYFEDKYACLNAFKL